MRIAFDWPNPQIRIGTWLIRTEINVAPCKFYWLMTDTIVSYSTKRLQLQSKFGAKDWRKQSNGVSCLLFITATCLRTRKAMDREEKTTTTTTTNAYKKWSNTKFDLVLLFTDEPRSHSIAHDRHEFNGKFHYFSSCRSRPTNCHCWRHTRLQKKRQGERTHAFFSVRLFASWLCRSIVHSLVWSSFVSGSTTFFLFFH